MIKSRICKYLGGVKYCITFSMVLLMVSPVFSQSITKEVVNTAGKDMVNEGMLLSWNIGTFGDTFFNEGYILEGIATDMGIEKLELKNDDFNIYPNPFDEEITINAPIEIGDLSMSLTDVNGRIVQRFELPKGLQTLHLDHLMAGVYLVRIFGEQSGYLKTSRIVKLN